MSRKIHDLLPRTYISIECGFIMLMPPRTFVMLCFFFSFIVLYIHIRINLFNIFFLQKFQSI